MKFECDGLLAKAIQHEVDHLNGILFIDRMPCQGKGALAAQVGEHADGNPASAAEG